jgi:protein SCO1/2
MSRIMTVFFVLLLSAAATPEAELPGDSLYHLQATFSDQGGHPFTLAELRGKPVLVAMFYTSCQYICPLMIEGIQQAEKSLDPEQRNRLQILMVSFDPAHDDTAALAHTANSKHLDRSRWRLARTDEGNVRQLAAVLGVRYRELADGGFNHTGEVTLLDPHGRVLARTEAIGAGKDAAFMTALRAALDAP